MAYRVRGSGPKAPLGGHELGTDTAQEALHKLRVMGRLSDRAEAWDDQGREVGLAELERLAEQENAADREALRRDRGAFRRGRA